MTVTHLLAITFLGLPCVWALERVARRLRLRSRRRLIIRALASGIYETGITASDLEVMIYGDNEAFPVETVCSGGGAR